MNRYVVNVYQKPGKHRMYRCGQYYVTAENEQDAKEKACWTANKKDSIIGSLEDTEIVKVKE